MKIRSLVIFLVCVTLSGVLCTRPSYAMDLFNRQPQEWGNQKSPTSESPNKLNALTEDWTNTNINWGADPNNITVEDLQTVGGNL